MMKSYRHLQKKSGFTLVELLVYFGLFSILLVVLSSVFITMLEQQTQDTAQSALQQESEYILTKLKYEINNADEIVMPASPGATLQSLTLRTDGTEKVFSLVNSQLVYTFDTVAWQMTSNEIMVTDLEFENQTGTSLHQTVGIHVEMRTNLPQERTSYNRIINTTVTLR